MFGIRYVKVPPTTYIMQFRSGKIVRSGAGLSFFYFAPNSDLVKVPLATADVPFVFNEVTADFQDATIQGELTYRIQRAEANRRALGLQRGCPRPLPFQRPGEAQRSSGSRRADSRPLVHPEAFAG